ncbi:MAG: response regulator [Alphaproteobacteria bacterium]|nr:response regulator [Alphaproteobacteria bacterium]MCD8570497.1 response regulator [Alphaproteobacteria bacterium]
MGTKVHQKEDVTVLVVEDNDIDVMGIQRAFSRAELSNPVVIARNGVEALDKLRDGASVPKPYMILLDLNMPRMNGIEFLHETRNDPALKSSIVFVLTTSKDQSDKSKAYEHNVAGYIVKERGNSEFIDAAELLNYYTRVVEFP